MTRLPHFPEFTGGLDFATAVSLVRRFHAHVAFGGGVPTADQVEQQLIAATRFGSRALVYSHLVLIRAAALEVQQIESQGGLGKEDSYAISHILGLADHSMAAIVGIVADFDRTGAPA